MGRSKEIVIFITKMDNFNIHKFFKSEYLNEAKMSPDEEIENIMRMNPKANEKSLKKISKLGKDKVKEIVKKVVAQKQMDKPSALDSYMEFDPLMNEGVEKEMFIYLDELRDSGVTNMFGAAPYLQREFGLEKREAREILAKWMQSQMNEVELTQDFGELDEAELSKLEKKSLKKISKQLKKSVKSHDKQSKTIDKIVKENVAQDDAVNSLRDIAIEIEGLSDEARDIIRRNFPNELSRLEGYGVFNMIYSNNRYDVTLGKFVDGLEEGDYDDLDDEDYVNESINLSDYNEDVEKAIEVGIRVGSNFDEEDVMYYVHNNWMGGNISAEEAMKKISKYLKP